MTFVQQNIIQILQTVGTHLLLVIAALAIAVPLGIALGVVLSRPAAARISTASFYLIGLGQSVPSLAIVALAVGIIGVGSTTAIIAIALYSLPPVARNCYTGITSVSPELIEAGRGMGMSALQLFTQIEFPLAVGWVLTGVRIAAVYAVSTAALASLVGAGGLGEYVFGGIALFRTDMMLAGAVPTALMALAFDRALSWVEHTVRPVR